MSKKGQPKQAKHGASLFAMIPTCAFNDTRLTCEQIGTLGYLASYLNSRQSPWWPILQQEVADVRGTSRETVNRHIKHLVKLGYIYQRSRYGRDGGQMESEYRMHLEITIPREFQRVPVEESDEAQSEPEPTPPVILDAPCDPGVTPLCPQDHTPVILASHPRDPGVTPNIRMTDHLTDHLTEMASPSSETSDPDPDPEGAAPSWNEVHAWARTAIGREALAYFGEKGRWQYRLQRQACEDWARAHPVQWEILRESLASDARPAPAGLVGT